MTSARMKNRKKDLMQAVSLVIVNGEQGCRHKHPIDYQKDSQSSIDQVQIEKLKEISS
ncbi:hypothetical protein GCM10011573_26210 [Enterococcus wangshanyuanii]|uniref:Uncharacterized protein n=1 Tax=Enterococcus wangshanyuanii TaxID=2005703 RepID=A0ABQ1PDU9_9ENTE|nr:hypothetical protein GCM10011573_26210 [Enterococcus wangshanyuanii]